MRCILTPLLLLLVPLTVLGFTVPIARSSTSSSALLLSTAAQIPPPPEFSPKPLPIILGGGLFLFATSLPNRHKSFADELLRQAEKAMRRDATISMELGQGVEAGGIFSSQFANSGNFDQLVLQFQIEGGNAWAQGVAYGVRNKDNNNIHLVCLEVANMDASMNGTPFEIDIPIPEMKNEEETEDEVQEN